MFIHVILLLSQKNLSLHLNLDNLYPRMLSAILGKIDPGVGVKNRKSYQCIYKVIIFFPWMNLEYRNPINQLIIECCSIVGNW